MDQFPQQTPGPDAQPPVSPQLNYAPPGYQPGYASARDAGQLGYIPPNPTHKSRKGMWIILLIVAVLLIGGVGTAIYFVIQGQNTPGANGTLQNFCAGYRNLDAHAIYTTLSTHMQAQPSNHESTIQSDFSSVKNTGAKITSCTVSNVQQNGSTATGTVTVNITGRGITNTSVQMLKLVQEGGQWKIDAIAAHQ